MKVAVLCAARKSVYHGMDGVDVYDQQRDAYTYPGGLPIVAHPPCRHWSAFCRQQADPSTRQAEMKLGRWVVRQLLENGGVLEQPAFSRLFEETGLMYYTNVVRVDQYWWGYPTRKKTWLAFVNCEPGPIPYRLHDQGNDRRRMAVMSKRQRSETILPFAEWLVDSARKVLSTGGNDDSNDYGKNYA